MKLLQTWQLFLASFVVPLTVDGLSDAQTPTPTPYPIEFSMDFVTNVTFLDTSTDSSNNCTAKGAIKGSLIYSWPLKSQIIRHEAGSFECLHFYHTQRACSLLFLPTGGMYRILLGANEGDDENKADCCLDLVRVGTPPPDWASKANPTYQGVVRDAYSGLETNQWAFDNLTSSAMPVSVTSRAILTEQQPHSVLSLDDDVLPYHMSREVAAGHDHVGAPVLFTFPGSARGRQDYHFDVDSLVVGPQDPRLFELPQGCEDVLCSDKEEHAKLPLTTHS